MRIVVTGGAGFIGANLCRTLAAHDAIGEVVALDNLSTGFRHNLDGVDATLVEGDLTDPDTLDSVLHDAAAVVHLGARPSVPRSVADPLASHHANATGTIQVLDAARRAGGLHVVVASSSSVYGSNPTLPKHEDLATRPLSPYAASKPNRTTIPIRSMPHHTPKIIRTCFPRAPKWTSMSPRRQCMTW